MRIRDVIFGTLERVWEWTQSVDSRNRVALCKRDNWILLVEDFESKSIKEGSKIPNQQFQDIQRNSLHGLAIHYCS